MRWPLPRARQRYSKHPEGRDKFVEASENVRCQRKPDVQVVPARTLRCWVRPGNRGKLHLATMAHCNMAHPDSFCFSATRSLQSKEEGAAMG